MNDEFASLILNLVTRIENLEQTLVTLISYLSRNSKSPLSPSDIEALGNILAQHHKIPKH